MERARVERRSGSECAAISLALYFAMSSRLCCTTSLDDEMDTRPSHRAWARPSAGKPSEVHTPPRRPGHQSDAGSSAKASQRPVSSDQRLATGADGKPGSSDQRPAIGADADGKPASSVQRSATGAENSPGPQVPQGKRAPKGTAFTFNKRRPPKCPVRLAAYMKEYEAYHEEKREKKEAPKKKKTKKRSANQEAYANHLRVYMFLDRLGHSRERMVQAGAAWRQRHEKFRAAAGCGVATEA